MRLPPSLLVLASALALTLSSAATAHAQDGLGLNYRYVSTDTDSTVDASLPEQPPMNECILIPQVEKLENGAPDSDAFAPENTSTRANARIYANDECMGTPKLVLKPGSPQEPDSVTFRSVKFVLPPSTT
ncbi:hypothetical protein AB0L26_29425 [Streptomyces nondiastaticus]|uniref:hypothetical protein n=1 Tax=Streptomyces TaxID=1883 RepID=UPI002676DBC5|nr:hypothetical protein [Streptomyces sp. VNUA116]WKU48339.1 hypothetical protein Q3V23_32100 [Streptomyces sp. VNUA116]